MTSGNLGFDLAGLDKSMTSDIILGAPVSVQGVSLVPVVSVTMAYGKTPAPFEAGGGGFVLEPIAVVVIRDSEADIHSFKRKTSFEGAAELFTALFNQTKESK